MSGQGKRLMVMAGGTGGHVFPGLAVAHHLMAQGWQVRWLGTADRMEADLVPKHGIEIDFIRISGLRGKGIKALIAAPLRIFNAWRQARAIMKAYKPDVVLGMGGYVSGPGGLAAWSLGIPVVLHEQNGIAGLTNKWLAKIATKVMQAFPGAFPNAEVVGNPVRTDVLALPLRQYVPPCSARAGIRITAGGISPAVRNCSYIRERTRRKCWTMLPQRQACESAGASSVPSKTRGSPNSCSPDIIP